MVPAVVVAAGAAAARGVTLAAPVVARALPYILPAAYLLLERVGERNPSAPGTDTPVTGESVSVMSPGDSTPPQWVHLAAQALRYLAATGAAKELLESELVNSLGYGHATRLVNDAAYVARMDTSAKLRAVHLVEDSTKCVNCPLQVSPLSSTVRRDASTSSFELSTPGPARGVVHTSQLVTVRSAPLEPGVYGQVDVGRRPFEITISPRYSQPRQLVSLAHELVHVGSQLYKFDLTHEQVHAMGVFLATEAYPALRAFEG